MLVGSRTRAQLLGRRLEGCVSQVRHMTPPPRSAAALKRETNDLVMPPCDFVPKPHKASFPFSYLYDTDEQSRAYASDIKTSQCIQGLSYDEVVQIRKDRLTPSLLTYYKKPVYTHQGHKQWLFDSEGRRYLDMFAGIVTVSVGHCHPRVNMTAHEQIERLWHTTNIYMHPNIHEFAQKLTDKLPGNLKVCYFVNSGSEANDLAMMMMRAYTGAYDILCLRNSYHGAGPYTLGLLSHSNWKQNIPLGFGTYATSNPDVYRGPWGGKNCRDSPVQALRDCDCRPGECKACDNYIDQLQEVLDYQVPSKVAGLFAEPIQGVGGTVQYPKDYLKRAYEKIRSRGGLCLADEVQTGFGRTGEHYWGFEGHDVIPDIVTMAKGICNGFPMAAVVTTHEIAKSLAGAIHFNTFGGNPMACAIASTVLDSAFYTSKGRTYKALSFYDFGLSFMVIEDEQLQLNSDRVGTYLLNKYALLREEFSIVGDVRGKGLMIGIEMVTDKDSKTPLPADRMTDIWERTKDYGVLFGKGGRFGNVFRIKPPMCITTEDADFSIAVLRRAIKEHLEESS